jgi:sterol desaturase/sphingolipid hydroxylase (fatty acid hydroxylase superfamily)
MIFQETGQHLMRQWDNCVSAYESGVYDHALLMWLTFFTSWHLFAAFFAVLDHTRLLWKYKLVINDPVSWSIALPTVLFNQIVILLPAMLVASHYKLAFTHFQAPNPVWIFPLHLFLLGAVHDVIFYFGHRLLHLKVMFKFHKKHHSSTGGCAAASLYFSPLDFIIEIILPYGCFLSLVQTHVLFDVILGSIGSLLAMYEHSGYCFTYIHLLDSRMHLSHHAGRFIGSLSEGCGSPGFMDDVFGTKLKDENYFIHEKSEEKNK